MRIKLSKSGFTLVELLVVISIIALLLAIMMPSLSKARDQARLVLCSTRMKQMGTLFQIYLSDSDDYFPPYSEPFWGPDGRPESGRDRYWPRNLASYDGKWTKDSTPPKYFFCSVQKKDKIDVWESNVGFGFNYYFLNKYPGSDSTFWRNMSKYRRKASDIKRPSERVVLAETRFTNLAHEIDDTLGMAYVHSPTRFNGDGTHCANSLSARHGQGMKEEKRKIPVLWVDCHVSTVVREMLINDADGYYWGSSTE